MKPCFVSLRHVVSQTPVIFIYHYFPDVNAFSIFFFFFFFFNFPNKAKFIKFRQFVWSKNFMTQHKPTPTHLQLPYGIRVPFKLKFKWLHTHLQLPCGIRVPSKLKFKWSGRKWFQLNLYICDAKCLSWKIGTTKVFSYVMDFRNTWTKWCELLTTPAYCFLLKFCS